MDNIEQLLVDMKESLEREMRTGFGEMSTRLSELNTRFDTQAARLDRQASLIQVGSRFTSRMIDWSEKVDRALEKKDHEIADLRKRIEDFESGDRPSSS